MSFLFSFYEEVGDYLWLMSKNFLRNPVKSVVTAKYNISHCRRGVC